MTEFVFSFNNQERKSQSSKINKSLVVQYVSAIAVLKVEQKQMYMIWMKHLIELGR